ncbi:MAG: stage III sporulation protein AB [Oscillospiraceae bacterium]
MIRIIGAALIIASTGMMGLAGVRRLRARVSALEAVIASLDIMESEICSRLTPMREVLEKLSTEAPPPARALYVNAAEGMSALGRCSFSTIWSNAVKRTGELKLTEEEAGTLCELGLCLGRYDVREQAETIARVRRRMEAFLKRAEVERERDSKLHAFFGVASGLFAVIILL